MRAVRHCCALSLLLLIGIHTWSTTGQHVQSAAVSPRLVLLRSRTINTSASPPARRLAVLGPAARSYLVHLETVGHRRKLEDDLDLALGALRQLTDVA